MNAQTVVDVSTKEVRFGDLKNMGKTHATIQYLVASPGVGDFVPDGKARRVSLGDVIILEGHRFDLIAAYMGHQQGMVAWEANRQMTADAIRANLVAGIDKQVVSEVDKWVKTNAKPTFPEILNGITSMVGEDEDEDEGEPEDAEQEAVAT